MTQRWVTLPLKIDRLVFQVARDLDMSFPEIMREVVTLGIQVKLEQIEKGSLDNEKLERIHS